MAVKSIFSLKTKPLFLKNQRGVAVVEMLPLLAVFIILFGFTFAFWASIHRGILQSIAARYYAFRVINHRANLLYTRDTKRQRNNISYFKRNGFRWFSVVDYQEGESPDPKPTKKRLNLFEGGVGSLSPLPSNAGRRVNPIRLKTGYGICIDFSCGGRPAPR